MTTPKFPNIQDKHLRYALCGLIYLLGWLLVGLLDNVLATNLKKTKSPKQKSIQNLCERVEAEDWYAAEMSLGNFPQLGILLQDRRSEFRSCFTFRHIVSGSPS